MELEFLKKLDKLETLTATRASDTLSQGFYPTHLGHSPTHLGHAEARQVRIKKVERGHADVHALIPDLCTVWVRGHVRVSMSIPPSRAPVSFVTLRENVFPTELRASISANSSLDSTNLSPFFPRSKFEFVMEITLEWWVLPYPLAPPVTVGGGHANPTLSHLR